MTDTTDGLLAAILANPDCDATRLVYADYLQEQGEDARAELIRVQVEIAKAPANPFPSGMSYREREVAKLRTGTTDEGYSYTLEETARIFKVTRERVRQIEAKAQRKVDFAALRRARDLRNREVALLAHTAKAKLPWTPGGLTYWLKAKPVGLALRDQQHLVGLFVRGMIEDVTGSAANWLTYAEQVLAAHPVRKVTLTTYLAALVSTGSRDYPAGTLLLGAHTPSGEVIFRPCVIATADTAFANPDVLTHTPSILRAEWPGIEFELPPAATRTYTAGEFDFPCNPLGNMEFVGAYVAWDGPNRVRVTPHTEGLDFVIGLLSETAPAGATRLRFTLVEGQRITVPAPSPASPKLADAMAVAGLEEQAPVTQADWDNMMETLLRDATETP